MEIDLKVLMCKKTQNKVFYQGWLPLEDMITTIGTNNYRVRNHHFFKIYPTIEIKILNIFLINNVLIILAVRIQIRNKTVIYHQEITQKDLLIITLHLE